MIIDRETIETLVGTKISKIDLYQKAFTHKSALKENENLESFETLEFIGDSVLGFVITKFLFDRYEQQKEGFLTKARTKLVRGETLAKIAMKLEMYKWTQMDEKGMRNEWFKNPKILEDVFEAFIGAIYMDLGLLHAKRFILNIYENPELVDMRSIMIDDNYKQRETAPSLVSLLPCRSQRATPVSQAAPVLVEPRRSQSWSWNSVLEASASPR